MRLLSKDLQVARLAAGALAVALALPAAAQEFTTPRPSPAATAEQTVGTTKLSIEYSRPGVKGRPIWGADADPTVAVSVDAFEPYLDPAP